MWQPFGYLRTVYPVSPRPPKRVFSRLKRPSSSTCSSQDLISNPSPHHQSSWLSSECAPDPAFNVFWVQWLNPIPNHHNGYELWPTHIQPPFFLIKEMPYKSTFQACCVVIATTHYEDRLLVIQLRRQLLDLIIHAQHFLNQVYWKRAKKWECQQTHVRHPFSCQARQNKTEWLLRARNAISLLLELLALTMHLIKLTQLKSKE